MTTYANPRFSPSPLRISCRSGILAGLIAGAMMSCISSPPVAAEEPLSLTFSGTVEPRQRVELANQINGVISKVLVAAGQRVEAGQPLFELDSESFRIDVMTARAELDEARAKLRLAEDAASRQGQLAEKGVGARARAAQTTFERDAALAAVAKQESALARAELALARTQINAPLSGTMGRPRVSVGAFVEAEAGTVLGEIVQLDPVLVAYQIPYADRQRALEKAGTKAARDMFKHIVLTLEPPSGKPYAHRGTPVHESAEIDRTTGALTTWAEFPNPDGILVPGLQVKVISDIHSTVQHLDAAR